MDTTMMPQTMGQVPFYFFNADSKQQQQQMGAMYRQVHALPASPVYSRPNSSSSRTQPPTLYSNGPSVMTPAGSPPATHKPAIMLETDLRDSYFPSTPPLSTSGSSMGSPRNGEMLQTPMNPMFSGLDGFDGGKDFFEPAETSVLDWSSCGSPPMTPVYLQSQPGKVPSLHANTSDLLSTASCPSLSPSPTPYARSIAASEHDVDFCDPRNLTVSTGAGNPTLAPECTLTNIGELDLKVKLLDTVIPSQSSFDFTSGIPDGLPPFDDLEDLESEDDFVSSLVNLGGEACADIGRPRACTGSSVISLGHGSFIGDEDLSFDDADNFDFSALSSPCSSEEDCHQAKRQKKSHHNKDCCSITPVMAASGDSETTEKQHASTDNGANSADSDSNGSPESDGHAAPTPAPANRRGRKQSLTEDPSKTFVCDLCSRRFRRQEHLKRHYRSLHTQDKPFECNECGKKFSRSDNLAQHARTHAGGAIVMNLIEDGVASFEPGMAPMPAPDDYNTFGKVLFQIASEIPGSASESSSDEDKDDSKKKRKRSD